MVFDAGAAAKYDFEGECESAVLSDQLLEPVLAVDVHPVTVPSKYSLQIAPITVNALVRVEVELSGLVATTFQSPAAADARLTWQRRDSPMSWMPVAGMSLWPDLVSLTVVPALRLVPVMSRVTLEPESPLVGVMADSESGGGGGSSADEPEISRE